MTAIFTANIEAGGKWSAYVSKGKSISITAAGDRANLACLLFHAQHPSERYNMPDTLKAQHTALLTAGHVLMSDQGKVLASITEDTVGWHDTLSGYTTRESIDAKYGVTSYQSERNDWLRNAEQNLKVELFRHNLTARDFTTPINFFSKIVCELDGTMRYEEQATAGRSVTLRTEMDLLVVLSNTPNPMDPGSQYPDTAVELVITGAAPIGENDLCLNHCGENRRAFENTWNAYALMRGAN